MYLCDKYDNYVICFSMALLDRKSLHDRDFPLSSSMALFQVVAFICDAAVAFNTICESFS